MKVLSSLGQMQMQSALLELYYQDLDLNEIFDHMDMGKYANETSFELTILVHGEGKYIIPNCDDR